MSRTQRWLRVGGAVVAAFGALVAAGNDASAQNPAQEAGSITVVVRDSSGVGIAGAELMVAGSALRGESDLDGTIKLTSVSYGPTTVRVRRLGFAPATVPIVVEPGATKAVTVVLARVPQHLAPILVNAASHPIYTGPLAGFYQRRDRGIGRFLTRAEIEREDPMATTDLFRRIPGVRITSSRMARNAIRFRGSNCPPNVYIDGAPLGPIEFDFDALDPRSVEGLEIYSGPATVPPQFMQARGGETCGVIVVWSRSGEPRKKRKKGAPSPAAELAAMVEQLKVYTADQVDVPAQPDSASPVRPAYPKDLFTAGTGGTVVVEFVVDQHGQVETDNLNVVSSTHQALTDAVLMALRDATFRPAIRQGVAVRQVVELPFRFVAGEVKTGARD